MSTVCKSWTSLFTPTFTTAPSDGGCGGRSQTIRVLSGQPAAEAVEVGGLILKATEWSPQSHELFPEAARKRAVEVMRLGYLIAWDEERFDSREGAAPELADIWRGFVLPRVVVR